MKQKAHKKPERRKPIKKIKNKERQKIRGEMIKQGVESKTSLRMA